ncbi:GSCOCG00009307001-RA-CDS, partial [Cotesia congregata]
GGWSEWGPWICSASCNGGVGKRKRVCNNPEPNIKGEPCMGPSEMTGTCNTNLCGDITRDTITLINRRKKNSHLALVVKEGQPVTIPCDSDIVAKVEKESPRSEIQWSHDGIFVDADDHRIILDNCSIEIKQASVNDSGVYTMTSHKFDRSYSILKIVSLSVRPVKTIKTIRETLPMTVICHCAILGYVYANLKVSWLINKKIWKNYGTTSPLSINVDTIPEVNKSHHGLWECFIEEEDLKFNWTTNAILVNVISAPNWRTYLMEDPFTKPLFGWLPSESYVIFFLIFLILFCSSLVIVALFYYVKLQ